MEKKTTRTKGNKGIGIRLNGWAIEMVPKFQNLQFSPENQVSKYFIARWNLMRVLKGRWGNLNTFRIKNAFWMIFGLLATVFDWTRPNPCDKKKNPLIKLPITTVSTIIAVATNLNLKLITFILQFRWNFVTSPADFRTL